MLDDSPLVVVDGTLSVLTLFTSVRVDCMPWGLSLGLEDATCFRAIQSINQSINQSLGGGSVDGSSFGMI